MFVWQKREGAEGEEGEEDQESDDIVFSAAPEELEEEEVLEALELGEVEEGQFFHARRSGEPEWRFLLVSFYAHYIPLPSRV